jgi:glutamyl-tRNA synthetase
MSVRVRFAPSPTGNLHVGGARTALYNYLFARRHGGVFVLRIEDTDVERSTEESLAAILDALTWMGLAWDEGPGVGGSHGPYFQSQRRGLYGEHGEQLRARGLAYRCFCTAEELEERRVASAARGEAPRYDRRCLGLPAAEAERRAAREPHALRFRCPDEGETGWDDIVRGGVRFRNEVLDDFVLLRSDGLPTYNFACVVDDRLMAITHVVRGDDHISNTPRQLLLDRAFGWEPPRFAHVPMILGPDGSRLSKRHGATSVQAFREMGYVPAGLVNFLALLGWSYDGQRELFTLEELVQHFSLERVGSNPAVFNTEKLEWMNAQHLRALPEEQRVKLVADFLVARGVELGGRSPDWVRVLVRAIGVRLKTLEDAQRSGAFLFSPEVGMEPAAWAEVLERAGAGPWLERLGRRLEALEDWSLDGIEQALRGLAAELGAKAGDLIHPARVALTGSKVGLGIFEVIWLLGKEEAARRLKEAAARWADDSPHSPTRLRGHAETPPARGG